MNNAEFVTWLEKNEKRVTKGYKLGHDGHDGWCDCIGLIIGAWRLAGNEWNWTHGSNYTARYLVEDLGKNQDLHLGDLVFKGRQPGDPGYKLPEQYKKGTDQTDYYHVGVVTSTSPLTITHCTSGSSCRVWDPDKKQWVNRKEGGIKWDTARGSWKYSAKFKYLEGSEPMADIMIVTSPNGLPVNLRKSPSTSAEIITRISVGSQVNVIGENSNGWTYVSYGAKKGYMMSRFLKDAGTTRPADPEPGGVLWQCVKSAREALERAEKDISDAKVALTAIEEMAKNE